MHSEETNTGKHVDYCHAGENCPLTRNKASYQEWEMSAAYAAFEGYGEQDAHAEMEVYYTDAQEDPWWICFVPFWLR